MAARKQRVVGLGIMGGAFAHNFLTPGWRVIGAVRRRAGALVVKIATDAGDLALNSARERATVLP